MDVARQGKGLRIRTSGEGTGKDSGGRQQHPVRRRQDADGKERMSKKTCYEEGNAKKDHKKSGFITTTEAEELVLKG